MRLAWRPSPPRLDEALAASRRAALTYRQVGATTAGPPPGAAWREQRDVVSTDPDDFPRAGEALRSWGLQRAAGLGVAATGARAEPGVTVVTATPPPPGLPLALLVPCRVVLAVDEPRRRGFAYGTLPGHPLRGEEMFTVELDDADRVVLRLASFSWLAGPARLAPPAARLGQRWMNRIYARSAPRLLVAAAGTAPED